MYTYSYDFLFFELCKPRCLRPNNTSFEYFRLYNTKLIRTVTTDKDTENVIILY